MFQAKRLTSLTANGSNNFTPMACYEVHSSLALKYVLSEPTSGTVIVSSAIAVLIFSISRKLCN